ncbi:MAG: NAD(P)-dependent oxidoreductase [Bacteroidota bacterium]|nr:NAD(P)-dependent oxidoreductase [Bacteroidota bacterium]
MQQVKIGLIREGKEQPDKRVALTPAQCVKLKIAFPHAEIVVQPSPHRCIADEEYKNVGLQLVEDLSDCDILLGIKEVPVELLIEKKTYLFFSHTIKKQAHNRNLLREIIKKKIRLIDYETLAWENGSRILGFGRYAGIVGGHNGFLTYGKKKKLYDLKPAYLCKNYDELLAQYKNIQIPPIKICLTGDGRVSHGVIELFQKLNLREVTPRAYLQEQFDEPIYVHLRSEHYYEHKDSRPWDKSDFYHNPEDYKGTFKPYTQVTDLLVNGILWKPGVPPFFTRAEMKEDNFNIQVIADISCDIPGSLPSTLRATTIENPVYGYHKYSESEVEEYMPNTIDIMAVGNLPCELPYDASNGFGEDLLRSVMPHLLSKKFDDIILNATIAENGSLTKKYLYLTDYIS